MVDQERPAGPRSAAASGLQRAFRDRRFAVTAEVSPPLSADPAEFIAHTLPLRGLATAVNVTDGAAAKTHMSSLVAAHFLLQNGIEPILQMTCRDRNLLALQADLLGAVSLGIRNVLVLHGDEPSALSARWMREKLWGTLIPDALVDRLECASDPKCEGIEICVEALQGLAAIPGIAGAHVMAPRMHSALPEVISASGVAGQPRAAS